MELVSGLIEILTKGVLDKKVIIEEIKITFVIVGQNMVPSDLALVHLDRTVLGVITSGWGGLMPLLLNRIINSG